MDPWQPIIWKLALNDSPSSISPTLSRPESRKLIHLRPTMRSVSAAPRHYQAVLHRRRTVRACVGDAVAVLWRWEIRCDGVCDGALTREKSILVRSKSITRFSVFQSLLQAVYSTLISHPSFTEWGQSQRNKLSVGNSLNAALGYV